MARQPGSRNSQVDGRVAVATSWTPQGAVVASDYGGNTPQAGQGKDGRDEQNRPGLSNTGPRPPAIIDRDIDPMDDDVGKGGKLG